MPYSKVKVVFVVICVDLIFNKEYMANVEYTKEGIIVDGELLSLPSITKRCLMTKIKEEGLQLLSMRWPGGRGRDEIIENIVLPKDNISKILWYITDSHISFGEIAGKHSDVYGTLEPEHITVVTDIDAICVFLLHTPEGWDYNHSFLKTFYEDAVEGNYEDITEEQAEEFLNLYRP